MVHIGDALLYFLRHLKCLIRRLSKISYLHNVFRDYVQINIDALKEHLEMLGSTL